MASIPDTADISFDAINEQTNRQLHEALERNQNLVNTAAITTGNNFDRVASEAYVAVASGKMSVDEAVKKATNQMIDKGVIKVEYKSGRQLNIKSALEMNVRSTGKRVSIANSLDWGQQLGADAYETSGFSDCAPDHLWLNAKVFDDPDEIERVIEALQRPNCRHTIFPFWKGYSQQNDYGLPNEQVIAQNYKRQQSKNQAANKRLQQNLQKQWQESILRHGGTSQYQGKTLTQVERHIAQLETEEGVIFNQSGQAVFDVTGDYTRVNFGPSVIEVLKTGGFTVTHNHTNLGGSFSIQDLVFAAENNLAEVRVNDAQWLYIAKPKKQNWPADTQKLEELYIAYEKEERAKLMTWIAQDQTATSYVTAYNDALHRAISRLAGECDIIYWRKKRK